MSTRGRPKRSADAETAYLWLTRLYVGSRCTGKRHKAAFAKAVDAIDVLVDFPQRDRTDATLTDQIYKRVPKVLDEFEQEGTYPDDAIKRVRDSLAKHGKKN